MKKYKPRPGDVSDEELREHAKQVELEMKDAPWDYPGFVIVEGRYYSRLGFISFPPELVPPLGGDITCLIWRYADKHDEWIMTLRLRRNVTTNIWDFNDTKDWHAVRGSEKDGLASLEYSFTTVASKMFEAVGFPFPTVDWLILEGDHEKTMEAMLNANKSWLHVRKIDV